MPGDDAASNGATLWMPSGLYIPKTVEGEKLEAAKKFQAFAASPEGCEAQASAAPVGGPFAVTTCELPADVATAVEDLSAYVDAGNVDSCPGVPLPDQGPCPGADHRRGGLRDPAGATTARRSTTRTSRSRPSSSVSRAGNHTATVPGPLARGPGTPGGKARR